MAIDPERLEAQRLHLVARQEARCSRCGVRTTDKTGTCRGCRGGDVADLRSLSVERLAGLIEAAKAELKRRRDEIDAAMEGA